MISGVTSGSATAGLLERGEPELTVKQILESAEIGAIAWRCWPSNVVLTVSPFVVNPEDPSCWLTDKGCCLCPCLDACRYSSSPAFSLKVRPDQDPHWETYCQKQYDLVCVGDINDRIQAIVSHSFCTAAFTPGKVCIQIQAVKNYLAAQDAPVIQRMN